MWTRRMLKDGAKDFLRRHYWKAFVVCLIVIIVNGGSESTSGSKVNLNFFNNNSNNNSVIEQQLIDREIVLSSDNKVFNGFLNMIGKSSPILVIATSTLAFFTLLFIILTITIGYALTVGQSRFFLRGFKEDVSVSNLFSVFNRDEYFGVVKTMFVKDVYNILWFFLFIIPGIIKAYEYSMVPYILSKDPNIATNDVIKMSREMTNGHKWEMFVLDLSFIGWDLLASLLFGIGFIFLRPYKESTRAKLYNVLSHEDFDDNIILE